MRLRRLRDLMEKQRLDLVMISDPKNVYYFTSLSPQSLLSLVHSFTLLNYLLVFSDGRTVLLTSQRDAETVKKNFEGDVVSYVNYDLTHRMIAYPNFVAEELKRLVSVGSPRRVGVESWHLPYVFLDQFNDAEFYDLSKNILQMRTVKDADELLQIRKCCELNDFAFSIAKSASIRGRSEIEVYAKVQEELTKRVGTYQFFAGDFASGERSLEGGGPPTSRILNDGETFILDLWLTWNGYWSDTCRTFVIGGRPTQNQARALGLLKKAMAAGEEKLRPGVKASDVYKAVFDVINAAGLGDRFTHHAGHGIGLDDQESPFFIPGSNEILLEGMVCTLEPGIYVPGTGGLRIEHDYVVGQSGPERLTSFSLDL